MSVLALVESSDRMWTINWCAKNNRQHLCSRCPHGDWFTALEPCWFLRMDKANHAKCQAVLYESWFRRAMSVLTLVEFRSNRIWTSCIKIKKLGNIHVLYYIPSMVPDSLLWNHLDFSIWTQELIMHTWIMDQEGHVRAYYFGWVPTE